MKQKQLVKIFLLTISVWVWGAISATATVVPNKEVQNKSVASVLHNSRSIRQIRQLSEIERPSTSATMLVQSPTPNNPPPSQGGKQGGEVIPITGVKANPTPKGMEVILETLLGTQLQVTNRSTGNNFIVDVSGGQLRLPDGNAFTFRSEKPLTEITEITVTNIDATTVRVTVVGEKALPKVELFDDNAGLVFGIATAATATQPLPQLPQTPQQTPSAEGDQPIELVVTGEQDGYRVPNSSVGTRTDTPLRDIPQTIQVIPQQVLRDQNVTRLQDATRNIAGATQETSSITDIDQIVRLRGFLVDVFRNGLRDQEGSQLIDFANVERVEALSGPASVIFGRGLPGGVVNIVTKQPLRDPFYAVNATIGSFDFYRGAIDLSGPLNDSKTVLYRLNAAYQDRNAFVDLFDESQSFISPVVSLALGDRTQLTLEGEYTDTQGSFFYGLPIEGTLLPNPNGRIPRNRNTTETDLNRTLTRFGYRLEHQFSDNWSLENVFRASFFDFDVLGIYPDGGGFNSDNRTINRVDRNNRFNTQAYGLQTYLTGKFSTGSINHQLLFGVDLNSITNTGQSFEGPASTIDVFNPVYGQPAGPLTVTSDSDSTTDSLGFYVQDQVTLAPNLKLLLGGRFDLAKQTSEDFLANIESSDSSDAFTPRVGIVYQPIQPISLYASYATSFNPQPGTDFERNRFQPERGTQCEVGIKADLNDQLSATLAFYDLTLSNVLTEDRDNPGFSVQVGEQQSRGFDLTFQGKILPGWSIIAGYAHIDAKVTEDNTFPVGTRFGNVPENSFNLWTKYEFQHGSLQGFGVGVGLYFVGERPGFFDSTYELPSYLRTDAALYYQRNKLRVAVNFRNLFDTTYFENSFGRARIFYGEPFAVQGTISWEF
ncbi:MAG: TonB-dependent siderophore receptor [Nostoc sp.]|uniref:TonB-dependent siderophore receptor n=1 Tax=Nostoc sp. TaxID=1180 RepID=UPI002FF95FEB